MTAIRAAGILFVSPLNNALFLKRGSEGDFAQHWCLPGGHQEANETAEQTAIRETIEEIGFLPKGERVEWTRSVKSFAAPAATTGQQTTAPSAQTVEPVDFTTFAQHVKEQFEPTINSESVGYAWAPIGDPPEPLHPGCRIALQRFGLDELGVARAIMAGDLTSPQRYQNVSLFNMRITGTGVAYRRAINEFVFRRPEHYLNDEFLARCNGLPVIMMHPDKAILDSKEFSDRMVGTMLLPYVRGAEVWGVTKIYDADALALLLTKKMSTSPSVLLRTTEDTARMTMEDGAQLLIEGKPSLLDHLAICSNGVWDKGEGPSGIESVNVKADDDAIMDAEGYASASFISEKVGTKKWVKANRWTPNLREKYDYLINQKEWDEIQNAWRAKADFAMADSMMVFIKPSIDHKKLTRIDQNLTVLNARMTGFLASRRA